MFGHHQPAHDFLTPEEASEVESALLSSRDKFTARVAIYSLRVLKRIAQEQHVAIATITQEQIIDWVNRDDQLQAGIPSELETNDESFKHFFSKLVGSSLKPLHQISQETGVDLDHLAVTQVVQWFEKEAKARIKKEME